MTVSPLLTMTDVTVPEFSASMLFCIFMASSTTTTSPALTAWPTATFTSVMVPGSGAVNAFGFDHLGLQLLLFACGAALYALLTFAAYRKACRDFEKIDL